jgi:hypothetical protein
MTGWHMPYPDSSIPLFRVALRILAVATAIIVVTLIVKAVQGDAPSSLAPLSFFLGFLMLFARRLGAIALFVSAEGLRIRTLLRNRTVSWPDIAGFGVGAPRFLGVRALNERLSVRLKDGALVSTPIWRMVRPPTGRSGRTQQILLYPPAFDDLVAELRQALPRDT